MTGRSMRPELPTAAKSIFRKKEKDSSLWPRFPVSSGEVSRNQTRLTTLGKLLHKPFRDTKKPGTKFLGSSGKLDPEKSFAL